MSRFTRSLAAVTLGVAVGMSMLAPAQALPVRPAAASDVGLFGSSDPTYDGVLRQSYALLGLAAVGAPASDAAIGWLVSQQCANGAFMSYRTDECTPGSLTTYTGIDSNSTAAAALALFAVGRTREARSAVDWLIARQMGNGGWAWIKGLNADPVSTGMALQALRADTRPSAGLRVSTRAAASWIRSRVTGCSGTPANFGGIGFSPQSTPDGFSTAEALLGLIGTLPVSRALRAGNSSSAVCNTQTSPPAAMSRFLVHTLDANRGAIPGLMDSSQPDWNATAFTILALVASGNRGSAVRTSFRALSRHVDDYTLTGAATLPAALGTLLLVAHATGAEPMAFGPQDIDLITRLQETQRA